MKTELDLTISDLNRLIECINDSIDDYTEIIEQTKGDGDKLFLQAKQNRLIKLREKFK